MSAARYERMARLHWQTYRPTETASLDDPETFFRELGVTAHEEVEAMVAATELPATGTAQDRVGMLRAAQKAAEEAVLAELVLVEPEPGREDARLPGTALPGWEDEPAG